MIDMGEKQQHHILVQAPVPAVDVAGLAVVTVGTALFALASIACVVFHGSLQVHGRDSWTAISISGFVLGLIGLAYCWYRRIRRARRPTA
jgi:hypothetical protein